jgi:putative aldouronate transport system substrate-binding protein
MKRIVGLVVALVVFTGAAFAGGQKGASGGTISTKYGDLAPVELEWYSLQSKQPDDQMIADALNEYIQPLINAKVNIHFWQTVDFESRAKPMIASGEDMGIVGYGGAQRLDYIIESKNGSFYPMEDLLDKYGQGIKALFSPAVWKSMTIDGHIYGFPVLRDNAYLMPLVYNKTLADDLGLDMENSGYTKRNTLYGMESFFNEALARRDAKYGKMDVPLSGAPGWIVPAYFSVEVYLTDCYFAVSNIDGINDIAGYDSSKVFNLYATDEFREVARSNQRMVQKGIYSYDYENTTKMTEESQSPYYLGGLGWGYAYVSEDQLSPNFKAAMIYPTKTWTDNNSYFIAGESISANCKNPERAMMFLEIMNTDPKAATLMRMGIEGQHYLRTPDGKMTFEGSPRNSNPVARGYLQWYGAQIGNVLIVEAPESYAGPNNIMLEKLKYYNEISLPARHLGFVFNPEPVTNELVACTNVESQYKDVLRYGHLSSQQEVDATIAEFNKKLADNGLQKILDEITRQIAAWEASR